MHKLNTKFPSKTVYFLGVRGLTSFYAVYDYTTSGHMDLYSMYLLYIHFHNIYIYLFLIQYKCNRLSSILFGTVHSNRTVAEKRTVLFWVIPQRVVVISDILGQPIGPILRVQETKRKPIVPNLELYRGRVWAVKSLSSMVSANRVVASVWDGGECGSQ